MPGNSRPWYVLGCVVTAQLMVAVDATILALALPSAIDDLGLSSAGATWVMAGYVLTAGSLMITGGRIAQAMGYRLMMSCGLIVFGIASAVGGSAGDGQVLIAARVVQGVGAAVLTPAAMARLSAAFPGDERQRAYGIFGMVMGSGTAIGVLLGGILTESVGWRWCMYINILFVVVALTFSALARDRSTRSAGHFRGAWRGLILATGAGALLQALTETDNPTAALTFALAGIVVLAVFLVLDRTADTPMIPVALFTASARVSAYLALFLWGVATIATFVGVSETLQRDLAFSPLVSGALFLIYPVTIQTGLLVGRRGLLGSPASSIGIGLILIGIGQAVLAVFPAGLPSILLALGIMGFGTSRVMPTANSAMNENAGRHAGVAGAIGSTLQQLGGSVGLAIPVALLPFTDHAASVAAGVSAISLVAGAIFVLAIRKTPTFATTIGSKQ
ncbi:MFS transporter [Rhodococcus sp. H29-C3]|uniref:MFS transporter n=1 Tax=Rhodococcus sp. H29-C3 TaxID=3046307 RepID=UPI0024BB8D9C|nr:MFS transporter [Rhodococcus sp. H29-C3]MDJ0363418.1 MFS transporter [Rhodococcus sp. H29-C3]